MANGIVHDFRNPMSAMRLDVQLLGREAARGDACRPDRLAYPIRDGIPVMLEDEARRLPADEEVPKA